MKTAIITPNKEDYLKYVKENMFEDFHPVHVKDKIDVVGNVFKELVVLPQYIMMPYVDEIIMSVVVRLRK